MESVEWWAAVLLSLDPGTGCSPAMSRARAYPRAVVLLVMIAFVLRDASCAFGHVPQC